jgi:hypothetical protein
VRGRVSVRSVPGSASVAALGLLRRPIGRTLGKSVSRWWAVFTIPQPADVARPHARELPHPAVRLAARALPGPAQPTARPGQADRDRDPLPLDDATEEYTKDLELILDELVLPLPPSHGMASVCALEHHKVEECCQARRDPQEQWRARCPRPRLACTCR